MKSRTLPLLVCLAVFTLGALVFCLFVLPSLQQGSTISLPERESPLPSAPSGRRNGDPAREVPPPGNHDGPSPDVPLKPAAPPPAFKEGLGTIEGTVLDSKGLPMAEMAVNAEMSGFDAGLDTKTDHDGAFRFPGVRPGDYRVSLGSSEQPASPWPKMMVNVEAGKTVRLVFGGPDAVRVEVTVRDSRGNPIEGAHLVLRPMRMEGEGVQFLGLADAEGRFAFEGVPPGPHSWVLHLPDDARIRIGRVEIPNTGLYAWALDIEAQGGEVRVKAVEADTGTPLANVIVTLMTLESPSLRGTGRPEPETFATKVTDAGGNVLFDSIPPGRYRLDFQCRGFASMEKTIDVHEGPAFEVRIALRPAAVVKVRALDDLGRPVREGLVVRFTPLNGRGGRSWGGVCCGPEGFIEVDTLPAGEYSLKIEARGYRPVNRTGVVLAEGDNPPIEIVLEKGHR